MKGDLTAHGMPSEFHEVGDLLGRVRVPVRATFGNHEFHDLETDGRPLLERYGIHVPREPWADDRPGIRLVFAHTPRPGERSGAIDDRQRARLVALAAAAPGPAFVVLHHQPQRWRWPTEYPPGIQGPEARAFLDELAAANPASFVASGHTHRHRRRRHGPIEVVEVGSTKDYPGTWTGYAIHEGGIRQVVRRIAAPDVIAWTETTGCGRWRRLAPLVTGPVGRPLLHPPLAGPLRPAARPSHLTERFDAGLDAGQALAGQGVQALRLLVQIGRLLDPDLARGQAIGQLLQGRDQLLEVHPLEARGYRLPVNHRTPAPPGPSAVPPPAAPR